MTGGDNNNMNKIDITIDLRLNNNNILEMDK